MLRSITEVKCSCKCGWTGTVIDCEPDVDGDGGLGCPCCMQLVNIFTTEFEKNPRREHGD